MKSNLLDFLLCEILELILKLGGGISFAAPSVSWKIPFSRIEVAVDMFGKIRSPFTISENLPLKMSGDPQIMCTTLKLLQKLVLSGDPWLIVG